MSPSAQALGTLSWQEDSQVLCLCPSNDQDSIILKCSQKPQRDETPGLGAPITPALSSANNSGQVNAKGDTGVQYGLANTGRK